MISRQTKTLFYLLAGPLLKLNGFLYRNFRAPKHGTVKVHLGPGQKNYMKGWINVDANIFTGQTDVWADLRNRLPFRDNSVDVFYSHHVIEHLPDYLLPFHFKEMYRCLKPNGIIRIGGPNGDVGIKKFLEGDKDWFGDFPDKRRSIGGRFANFILCRGEHLTILTFSYMEELAMDVGFCNITMCLPATETEYSNLIDTQVLNMESESTPDAPHTLIFEAVKP